jgi:hemerythrin-like metal-binding protein
MSLFQWSEALSVGYPDIDSQLKRLFQLANQLQTAMTAGKGKQVVSNMLHNLVAYAKRHFADEEVLMQLHRFPGSSQHKVAHEAQALKLVLFERAFSAGQATVTMEVQLQSLHDWLVQHIQEADKKVADHLRQRVR